MRIGILDTKVSGQPIDNVDLYKQQGYEIINAKHLDDGKKFDIVATTWTRINEKRIRAAKIKGVVVKDNDEPGNVLDVDLVKRLGVPYNLIGLWGISTRVDWNLKQIATYHPNVERVLMIADTPSHDAINRRLVAKGIDVIYPITPKEHTIEAVSHFVRTRDVVIVHLGKDDYPRYWLDPLLYELQKNTLLISTTRGPIYRANAINRAVTDKKVIAVLDWAWEEDKLIQSERIIHTGHSSYRSEQSGTELSIEVIKAVNKMKKKLNGTP